MLFITKETRKTSRGWFFYQIDFLVGFCLSACFILGIRVEIKLIFAQLLGIIHRLIRTAEQIWIGVGWPAERRADAERHDGIDLLTVQQLRQGLHDLSDFLMNDALVGGAQEDAKFIAADPPDQIALAETGS